MSSNEPLPLSLTLKSGRGPFHVTRQTALLAYQMGDGFTNIILPTSSMLMGSLSVSGIIYQKWVKFMWPLMVIWVIIGAVFVIIANLINYT